MKETSIARNSGVGAAEAVESEGRSSPGWRRRALVRSRRVTRASWRNFSAIWPQPVSTARTLAAPCCSMQSVKPPVLAPMSTQASWVRSMDQWARAFSSLRPPRLT